MIKQCKICGKDFVTYPSKIKAGKGKYCSKLCSLEATNKYLVVNGKKSRFKKGETHEWHTHRIKNDEGYIEIYSSKHPFCTSRGYVREHRLIMEEKVGRYLKKEEDVHHINGIKEDNRIENLELLSHSEHTRLSNPVLFRWNGGVCP